MRETKVCIFATFFFVFTKREITARQGNYTSVCLYCQNNINTESSYIRTIHRFMKGNLIISGFVGGFMARALYVPRKPRETWERLRRENLLRTQPELLATHVHMYFVYKYIIYRNIYVASNCCVLDASIVNVFDEGSWKCAISSGTFRSEQFRVPSREREREMRCSYSCRRVSPRVGPEKTKTETRSSSALFAMRRLFCARSKLLSKVTTCGPTVGYLLL